MQNFTDALGIGEKDHHYVDAEVNDETRQKRLCSIRHVTKTKAAGDAGQRELDKWHAQLMVIRVRTTVSGR